MAKNDSRFINYCVVMIGNINGGVVEIEYISEIKPNTVIHGGLMLATFVSVMTPVELRHYFTDHQRNFLLFELDPQTSAFGFTKDDITDGLFGFLNKVDIEAMTNKLANDIDTTSRKDSYQRTEVKISLEDQLNEALVREDYMKAAEIRDIINQRK
jgi:hypothetical protein